MKIFKNSFGNLENIKFQVTQIDQNDSDFYQILNNIQGDKFQKGISFDKLVLHSLNYLFVNCVNSSELLDSDWNLDFAKALLDKNNCTGYTPITTASNCRNIAVYKKQYYKEAFAFIQLAHYLNSIDLKTNQFFVYINHYLTTKTKLPDSEYKLDIQYLHKKYNDLDKSADNNFKITAATTLKNHFYGCLYILCNDLGLNTSNFKSDFKQGRDYNPMVKVPREFRKYFPFLLDEYDIKTAYPHFIDLLIDSNAANNVYESLSLAHNIERSEAKVLFNKYLNSGKYHNRSYFKAFFEPIYKEHTEKLIDLITDLKKPIWSVLQLWEMEAINNIKESNNLKNVTRLHDSIIIINDKFQKSIRTKFNFYEFGYKQLNKIDENLNFEVSKKNSRYSYVNSIPAELKTKGYALQKDTKKGIVFKDKFFNIYTNDFEVWKCGFNIAYRGTIVNNEFKYITADEFTNKLKYCIDVLAYLNADITKGGFVYIINEIVAHIYENGVYSFNKDYLVKLLINHLEEELAIPKPKIRNWHFVGNSEINNIDFYQFNQYRNLANRNARKFFCANAMIDTIKYSYNTNAKKFIRLSDLGLNDKRQAPEVADLVNRFNAANGFNDEREAKTIKEVCTKVVTLYNSTIYKLTEIVHNIPASTISKEFNINRRTATKFKKWIEQPQDKAELKAILQHLNNIIDEQSEIIVEEKQALPKATWNEAFNVEEEEIIITKTEENVFKIDVEIKQAPTPKKYINSILNCSPENAIRNDIHFITSWLLFQNPTLSESVRSLIKNNPQRTADYVKELYYNNQEVTWSKDLYLGMYKAA
jgi:hypothetical protein